MYDVDCNVIAERQKNNRLNFQLVSKSYWML